MRDPYLCPDRDPVTCRSPREPAHGTSGGTRESRLHVVSCSEEGIGEERGVMRDASRLMSIRGFLWAWNCRYTWEPHASLAKSRKGACVKALKEVAKRAANSPGPDSHLEDWGTRCLIQEPQKTAATGLLALPLTAGCLCSPPPTPPP